MKKINKLIKGLGLISLILISGIVNAASIYPPDKDVVKEDRPVSGFTAVDISSAFHVYLTQGDKEALTVEADQDILDRIKTVVVGNTLKIYVNRTIDNYDEMNIYLTFKELDYIELSGAVNLEGQNDMRFDDLEMDLSGASEIDMDLTFASLDAEFSGACDVEMKGKGQKANLESSGASKVDLEDLIIQDCVIDASGASHMKVNVTGKLEVDASGATSVRYKGSANVHSSTSGASSVRSY